MLVLSKLQHALYFLSVIVSFDPTTYTVTEGVDSVANLMLVRSEVLTRTVVVSVTTVAGTATGTYDTPLSTATLSCHIV